MTELLRLGRRVADICDELAMPCCLIGGLALIFRGEDRTTRDVDMSVLTGFGNEHVLIDRMLEAFEPRVANARDHALTFRVLLLQHNRLGLDIGLAAFDFEKRFFERAVMENVVDDVWLPVITAEDLIVMKAFADRPQDWVDLRGVIIRNEGKLDWDYTLETLEPLAVL